MQEHADDSFMLNLLFAERIMNCDVENVHEIIFSDSFHSVHKLDRFTYDL
jgi:hypothetical protein